MEKSKKLHHDIASPLSVILIQVNRLIKTHQEGGNLPPEKILTCLQQIKNGATKIEGLLSAHRIELENEKKEAS